MAIRFPFQRITAPTQLLFAAALNVLLLAFVLSPGDGGGWLPSSRTTEAAAGQAPLPLRLRAGLDVLDDAPPRAGWEPPIIKDNEAAPKQQQVAFELQMPAPGTRERAPERPASTPTQAPVQSSTQPIARPAPATEMPPTGGAAAASAPIAPQQPGPEPVSTSVREAGLIAAMNAARGREGLAPLRPHPTLMSAARSRTTDMLANNYFAHIGPTGQSWYTALANSGWSGSGGGENLARVSGDDASSVAVAFQKLMESPTHRANIMNPAFRLVGVGADTSAAGATIFTTIFTDR